MRPSASRPVLAALILVAVAIGGWFAWQRWSRGGSRADALVRLEEALGGSDPLALASVDLEQLRPLLGPAAPTLEAALLAAAGLDGMDGAGEASRLFLALSREAGRIERSAVLLGRFDVAALEAALEASAQGGIEESARAGARVLLVERVDPESCEPTRIGVALSPGRVVIAEPGALDALLARLGDAGLGLETAEVGEPLFAARWSAGLALPEAATDPGLRALAGALRGWIGEDTSLRASLQRARRKSFALEVELAARDAAGAGALLERLRVASSGEVDTWIRDLPALERWWDALEWSAESSALRASATLGLEAASFPELADDGLLLAARAFQAAPFEPSSVPEPWPPTFREFQPLGAISAYSKDAPLAGAADAIAGPFGIRVERVRADGALEVELRAVGPAVANLPAPAAAPRLVVESVASEGGEELLAARACGPARAGLAQPLLRSTPAQIVEAIQPLRLRAGAGLDEVASIRGRVELDLPVRIQSAVSGGLAPGTVLEGPGVALEICAHSPIGFAYRVRGDAAGLLYVRGLDAAGAPLSGRQEWQALLPVAGQSVGALRYSGALASVEAVFALERQSARWPFELESARPGSDGEAMHVESSSFIDYSAEQYDREFGAQGADPLTPRQTFAALADAGPFRVGLGELVDPGGLVAPALTVIAPDIPNLTYNASGLELELERVVLRDARSFAPGVRVPVAPGHRFGNLELEAEVRPATQVAALAADVERLSGKLVLRLPSQVDVLELAPVDPGSTVRDEGASFELSELVRDGFALRMRGPLERFFSTRAFGEGDRELAVRRVSIGPEGPDGAREIRFRVQGRPLRLQIQLSRSAALRSYAFELALPAPEPLPAAPQP